MKHRIGIIVRVLLLGTLVAAAGCGNPPAQTMLANSVNKASIKSANGLELSLSLDATTYKLYQDVSIVINEKNTLSKTNRISASNKRPLSGLSLGPCNEGSPFGVAILPGYYSPADVLKGTPLVIFDPNGVYHCPAFSWAEGTVYEFKPSSDIAAIFHDSVPPSNGTDTQILKELQLTHYWTGSYPATINSFEPGTYTIVAGDEWGALVVLHFTVTVTNTTATTNELTEWESKLLADNMVFNQGIATTIGGKDYLICSVNIGTNPEGAGTYADAGIIILDISNPDNPDEIAYLKNGQDEYVQFEGNLKLNGSILYALTYNYLWIIDVSDPFHPKDIGKTPLTGAFSIEVSGKYAYTVSSTETNEQILSTLDVSDPFNPQNVGQVVMQPYLITLESSGSLLFALASNGLYIFDTSTPSALKQKGFLSNPFPPLTGVIAPEHIPPEFFDMALAGKDLYIVSGIDKLLVVDVTNPKAARIINDLETRYQGNEIIISGGMAYLLSSDGPVQFSQHFSNLLESIDISNPSKPNESNSVQLESTYAHSYSSLIAVSNHLYFYDDRYPVIQIIDFGSLTDTLK